MTSNMDLKAKYLSDKCSDPIEFLNQLRQTTEPIGGGTEYSNDGELVEYEVAVIAIDKVTNALIKKVCEWLRNNVTKYHDVDWQQYEWYFETSKMIKDLKDSLKIEE